MKRIPVREAETVAFDVGKAAVAGAVGTVALGPIGSVAGLAIGGLMAKDKNVKIFFVGTAALAALGIFSGVLGNILGGNQEVQ